MPNCKQCNTAFEVADVDRKFYKKIDIPEPKLCPDCRQQRRLVWRNERSLYKRKCDLTGKSTISFYPAESKYKVYSQKAWWTDDWDAKDYGRDFDFNRPFFEQFKELMDDVPHMAMVVSHGENNDYCPYSVNYKNSYMCISGVVGENMYYSFWAHESKDCMDCFACFRCERCYECIQCINLYNSIFCKDSDNSQDLAFCVNCDHCKNCIGCYGLRHKEYYVFNKKVSPEEYKKVKKDIYSSHKSLLETLEKTKKHVATYPQRALQMVNTENCTGDYLLNCKNSHDCFLSEGLEDCAYMWTVPGGCKDSMDVNYSPHNELIYNTVSNVNSYHCIATPYCWDVKNSFYSFQCFYSQDLFGCMGLKHEKCCIFNKQYSKDEYEKLKTKIIEHMKKTGEWGEFFPISIAPYAYNETVAPDFFPVSREEVLKNGWPWSDRKPELQKVEKTIPSSKLPDRIEDVPDDILNWAVECEVTKKPFKIIAQELKFYREMNLPIPTRHPIQRQLERLKWLNPRKLWGRKCAKCGTDIHTSFAPERPETVYCESCYLKEVY